MRKRHDKDMKRENDENKLGLSCAKLSKGWSWPSFGLDL